MTTAYEGPVVTADQQANVYLKEEIDALRSWAIERARNASTIDFPSGNIDLDDEDL